MVTATDMDTAISKSKSLLRIDPAALLLSSYRSHALLPALIFITLLHTNSAYGSTWQFSKGLSLSLGVVRSDNENVNGADSLNEGSDTDRTITLSPYIALSRQTRRLSVTGRAGVVFRDTQSEQNARVDPDASLLATATLIDSRLFLDSSARVSRRLVNGSIIDDDTSLPDEAVDAYEFAIGPRWEQNLSRSVRAAGVYEFRTVGARDSAIAGSNANAVGAEIVKLLSNGKTQLGVRFEGQRDSFDDGDTASAAILIGTVAYSFRSNLTGRLLAGSERLEIDSTDFDENSAVYGAGITWQPTRRLFIEAGYSERAFGSTPAVSIRLQGRVSSIEFSWSRNAAISRSLTFGSNATGSGTSDQAGSQSGATEIDDITVDDLGETSFAPFASETENVVQEIALTYQLQGRISSFLARVSRVEQDRLSTTGGETANRVEFGLSRKLSKSIELDFTVSAVDGETTSIDNEVADLRRQQAFLTVSVAL